MNKIDKFISVFSPSWGLNRMLARSAIHAYEAAKPSRTHKARGTTNSADIQVGAAGRSIRAQARYLDENADLLDGLLTVLVNNIVGKDGIAVEPMPLDYSGNIHEEFSKTLLGAFSEWSLNPESTGSLTRPELERLVCRTWLRDGECFGELLQGNIPTFKHPNNDIPFSIQVLEPDFVPLDYDDKSKNIIQGIERNRWSQAVNYYIYNVHPGDTSTYNTSLRAVNAASMLHIKLIKRLHQGRGISILASTLQRISGIQNYEESELVAARIAAAMAFYIKKGDAESYLPPELPGQKRRQLSISPGTIFDDLRPGEDVGTIESKRPNALLQSFRDAMFKAICSATGANASTVLKTYNGTYSAQRQELVESYVSYGVLANSFIASWSRKVYRNFVDMAILSGSVIVPPDVDPRTVRLAFYQPPVMPWIDPSKEADGNTKIVSGGFGTEAEVIRSRGKNPAEVKRQRIREINENKENNLVFSSDAYHQFYGKSKFNEQNSNTTNENSSQS